MHENKTKNCIKMGFRGVSSVVISTALLLIVQQPVLGRPNKASTNLIADCDNLKDFAQIQQRIQSLKSDVDKIIELVEHGEEAGKTWEELALFCDTFGPRMSGSQALDKAIDYLKTKMRDQSKLNVTAEPAMIPKWEVYNQWAEMIEPRNHKMSILTLGSSVSTPNGTLEGEVIMVHDFTELDHLNTRVRDKIVVFNYKFKSYEKSVVYRTQGALRAAKYGASAALIRSVTPFSIYSPHAGMASKSIPTAAITCEDADLMERLIKRGSTVKLRLHIETKHFDDVQSFNLLGDITGTSRPNEVVFVSGHMDSWYNTDGAVDDGGGMMISLRALDILNKLNLRGERTMRAILWTSEEFGLIGAQQYFNNHKNELQNFKAVIESDMGTFAPLGLGFKNLGQLGQCVLWESLKLTQKIGINELSSRYEGSDIELFSDAGVPSLSLFNENSKYFYFHHTSGDSVTVENPQDLDRATILFATTAYVLSRLVDVDLTQ